MRVAYRVHERQKAPDAAASVGKPGFYGASRQITGCQNSNQMRQSGRMSQPYCLCGFSSSRKPSGTSKPSSRALSAASMACAYSLRSKSARARLFQAGAKPGSWARISLHVRTFLVYAMYWIRLYFYSSGLRKHLACTK